MFLLSEAIVGNLNNDVAKGPNNFLTLLLVLLFLAIGLIGIFFTFWDGLKRKILPSAKPQLPLF